MPPLSPVELTVGFLSGAVTRGVLVGRPFPPMLEHLRPPSGYREIAPAQHFSFLPICRPNAVELLAETHEEFICQEQAGTTREQIHTEALAAITTFLGEPGVLAGR